MGMCSGCVLAWQWIMLCWQCRQVCCHIFGKTAEDISGRNKLLRNEFPRVGNVVQVKKKNFQYFSGTTKRKTLVETLPTRC
jgi:hypothetical protein